MSLHIRLALSFWTNRKTLRLQSLIGEAALWIPPKLWSYAANNQPDGNFADYTDEEICMLLAYAGNAQALLQALLQAGFMDADRKIHDWQEHNSYHSAFSERARNAAKVRWSQKRKDSTRKDKKGKEPSIASSNAKASTRKPLSLDELLVYAREKGISEDDATAFFDSMEAGGWTRNGSPLHDWRAHLRSYKTNRYLLSLKNGQNGQTSSKTERQMSAFEIEKRISACNDKINELWKKAGGRTTEELETVKKRRNELKAMLSA